ncbi:hypothetical protein MUK42_06870 [Musa troglodytarum]|uniref:Uncharacterized protein n=1 Tax=Musa troglodytarum TaxID=320322 RepID=A0A9E7L151_9LILI|nr:hypothetical protein MUK42_06870 [Musa troglodytarum]URE42023.1 hypothetical protein MUK42_06870 [Musa troglodytarum]
MAAVVVGVLMAPPRKKWTEEEERSLLDKYAEMAADGSLSRLRTRERRFRPIAAHVNARHHAADPAAYPFLWSWKDAATKVHNMRHQYLLVKRKLLLFNRTSSFSCAPDAAIDDWAEQGISHWPNFLRYRSIFGDASLPPADPAPVPGVPFDDDGELGLGLAFDCCTEDASEGADREIEGNEGFDFDDVNPVSAAVPQQLLPPPVVEMGTTKRRKNKRTEQRRAPAAWWGWEARMEEREAERESLRRERKRAAEQVEEERERGRRQAKQQWREEELEWEERMEGKRAEWRKRMEGMLKEHQVEMEQVQAQILHEQQTVVGQLLGALSQWVASPVFGGLSDGGSAAGMGNHHHDHHQHHHQPMPYLSQMMQGLHHHVNGIVSAENRIDGDAHEDHFIVDH